MNTNKANGQTAELTLRQAAINEAAHYTRLDNIERSGFRRGEYVGYGLSEVVRIRRFDGQWQMTQANRHLGYGRTLAECSRHLHRLATREARHSE